MGRQPLKRSSVIAVALVAVVSIASGAMASVIYGYWQGQEQYNQVASIAFDVPLDETLGTVEDELDDGREGLLDLSSVMIDWNALHVVNPDVVAWVYVPNTPIDYPVVHSRDNDEYLYVNFSGEYANGLQPTYGTPFLLAQNAADFSDLNNVIQAHNMQNGTMFAWIANAALNDPAKLQESRTAYLFTPTANYRLTSVSVLVCGENDEVARLAFSSADEFASFVEGLVDRSAVKLDMSGFDVSKVGKLVSFSTCTSDGTGRRCVMVCAVSECIPIQETSEDSGESETTLPRE